MTVRGPAHLEPTKIEGRELDSATLYRMFSIGWDAGVRTHKAPVSKAKKRAAWRKYVERESAAQS